MNNNSTGELFAVGVGTGDSELLNPKSRSLASTGRCDCDPGKKTLGKADSFAWQIVTGAVPEEDLTAECCFFYIFQ